MYYRFQSSDRIYEVSLEKDESRLRAAVNGEPYQVEILELRPGAVSLLFEGRPITVYWANDGERKWVSMDGCATLLEKPASRLDRLASERAGEDTVRAPMPAQVRSLEIAVGDEVEKGQTLLLLEAMKMEIRIQAPRQGRIARLPVDVGQTVDRDQVLVEIEA